MFALLGIFAGFSLNLMLQFAIGLGFGLSQSLGQGLDSSQNRTDRDEASASAGIKNKYSVVPYIQIGCLFLGILIFWTAYYFVLKFFSGGFIEYFLIFPLSSLICMGVETAVKKVSPQYIDETSFSTYSALSGYSGLAPASFILTSLLAVNLLDGIIMAFFFALGCLLISAIIAEIKRRSFLERVPVYLKGNPLKLISMGLLSIVFAAVADICFKLFEH
jgi:Na+-translocating ferredoxin:NAD+ oxidoreductase RnfA subunit